MKKIAILVCLAMLISAFAMTASAAKPVSSNIDFTTMESTVAGGDETKAVMEGMGLIIPEGSNWEIVDHFYKLAMPKDGYAPAYYIQTLEAGEGKVLAEDATLELAHALAALTEGGEAYDVGWITVSVSVDGENYEEVWANEAGQGKEYTAEVFAIPQIKLTGTAGAAKIWVKIGAERHAGPGAGSIGWSKISGVATVAGTTSVLADFRALTPTDAGDASHAAMAALGITVPEGSVWQVQNCIQNLITPKDGYAPAAYIQTLDLGDKVLAEDAVLELGYYMAQLGDPSWMVIDWSTDGENWTDEGWVDETGKGGDWEAAEQHDVAIDLEGTAGASKVYVRVTIERHSGPIGGSILYSSISGVPTADTGSGDEGGSDETGDMIGVVVALLAVSGLGITVLKKKEN